MTEVTEKQNGAGDAAKVATKPTVSFIMLIKKLVGTACRDFATANK